jgi:hypothetical protein
MLMESLLQLYGFALVITPVYGFVSLRNRIRYDKLPRRSALMRYPGIVIAPVVAYAIVFSLALLLEGVTDLNVVPEEVARSFPVAMVAGIFVWIVGTIVFSLGLLFLRDVTPQNAQNR